MYWLILIGFFISFLLTLLSIQKISKNNFLKNYFISFNVIITIWLFVNFGFKYFNSFVGFKLAYATGALVVIAAIIITSSFAQQHKIKHQRLLGYICIGIIFFIFSMSDLFFKVKENIHFENSFTQWFILYVLFMVFALGFMIFKMLYCLRNFKGLIKLQAQYIFMGILAFGFFAFLMSSLSPLLKIPQLAILDTFGAVLFIVCIFHPIIKHNLMDINLAWRKILRGVLFFIIKISLLGVFFFLLSKLNTFSLFTNVLIAGSLLIIMDSFYSKKLLKVIDGLLLHRYKKIWNKLEKIVKSKNNKYAMADIVQVVVKDVASVLNIRESKYYCLVQGKYLSFFDQKDETDVELIPKILIHYLNKYKQFIYTYYLADNNKELKEYL